MNNTALLLLLIGATTLACSNTAPDDPPIAGDDSNIEQSKGTKASAILEGVAKIVYSAQGSDPVAFDESSAFTLEKVLAAAIDRNEVLDPNPALTRCMSTHSIALSDASGKDLGRIDYTCGAEPADGTKAVVRKDGKYYGITIAAKKLDDIAKASAKVGKGCPAADLSTLLCTAGGLLTCGMNEWQVSECGEGTSCNADSFDAVGACKP